jgi:hypothetical protein
MTDELPLTVGSKGQPLWTFEEVRKDYNCNPAAWGLGLKRKAAKIGGCF